MIKSRIVPSQCPFATRPLTHVSQLTVLQPVRPSVRYGERQTNGPQQTPVLAAKRDDQRRTRCLCGATGSVTAASLSEMGGFPRCGQQVAIFQQIVEIVRQCKHVLW